MQGVIKTTAKAARRLTVTKQHLAGRRHSKAGPDDIVKLIRGTAYIQWDPVTVVAPSHILSLWSRLGGFKPGDLERLLWQEKKVFLHWTPIASIVLTEDYPLYYSLMRRYPESLSHSWGNHIPRAKRFLAEHQGLRRRVLDDLGKGPLQLNQFSDYTRTRRPSDGWGSGSEVSDMLYHLLMMAEVMVVGHEGNQNVWGLTEEFLPSWAERSVLPQDELERETSQRAIQALGTASPSEIVYHYPRGRYQNISKALSQLEGDSAIRKVAVEGFSGKEVRYIDDKDVPLLGRLEGDDWEPRMSLIAAFDNLIAGRRWTNTVFGFDYVHEQFLPKNRRKYGTYVLPILWGENLIGRVDPKLEKEKQRLIVNSVHAEPGAPEGKEIASKINETIEDLARFIGAKEVEYTPRVPSGWSSALR
jgi:uncharacterized protein